MPRVVISGSAGLALTGGLAEFEVEAQTFRHLVRELEHRFPGLGEFVKERMAVAVDGAIYQDSYGLAFGDDSEVVLFPKLSGG